MLELSMTHHARRRAQQRGVLPSVIRTVFAYSDLELPVGQGCVALRLSCEALRNLQEDSGTSAVKRAKDIVLILADGVLVTVLHAYGAASRRYRRRRV